MTTWKPAASAARIDIPSAPAMPTSDAVFIILEQRAARIASLKPNPDVNRGASPATQKCRSAFARLRLGGGVRPRLENFRRANERAKAACATTRRWKNHPSSAPFATQRVSFRHLRLARGRQSGFSRRRACQASRCASRFFRREGQARTPSSSLMKLRFCLNCARSSAK